MARSSIAERVMMPPNDMPNHRNRGPVCIADLVRGAADGHPDRVAVLAPDQRALTYQGLVTLVESLAAQLDGMGIRANDRVAVVLENGPEMAVAFLAIASCATCAPLNPA